jgi:hypothetical protein
MPFLLNIFIDIAVVTDNRLLASIVRSNASEFPLIARGHGSRRDPPCCPL